MPVMSVYLSRSRLARADASKFTTLGSGLRACLCASTMKRSKSQDAAAAHALLTLVACVGFL